MAKVTVNGTEIYYELKGEPNAKKTIIFLNGVMASTGSWDLMLPYFDKHGYRILLHDFRGQLKSGKPESDWSFDDHVEDLAELMKITGIGKADLIGTSYGGEVALYFTVKYPEKVSSISVIDSVSELTPLLDAAVSAWIDAAELNNGRKFYRIMLPWLYSSSFIEKNSEMLLNRELSMENIPDEYFRGQAALYRTFLTIGITEQHKGIKCPALIICGEEDILKPPVFSEIIASQIENSCFVTLPDCGHVAIFEKPAVLSSIINGFLSQNSKIN